MLLELSQAVEECCTDAFPLLPLPLPCFLPSFPLQNTAVFSFSVLLSPDSPASLSLFFQFLALSLFLLTVIARTSSLANSLHALLSSTLDSFPPTLPLQAQPRESSALTRSCVFSLSALILTNSYNHLNSATSLPFLPLSFCHLPSLKWEGSKFYLLPCPQFQVPLACFCSFLKFFPPPAFSSL